MQTRGEVGGRKSLVASEIAKPLHALPGRVIERRRNSGTRVHMKISTQVIQ
jgi:hypothetical protein